MPADWQDLTQLTQGEPFVVERIRMTASKVALEGEFELPPLARPTMEDQVFIMAFVRCHGSIKQMEKLFGVSYPTIKARLNRLGESFPFERIHMAPPDRRSEILARLERGDITADQALEEMRP